jgi:hypothetical protein
MADLLASFVPLLGQALLHFIWQGTLIGLLAALLLNALRNARPQVRYAVACLALLLCVLAPIATMLLVLAPDVWGTDFGSGFATSGSDAGTAAGGPCPCSRRQRRSCKPTCLQSSRRGRSAPACCRCA